MSNDVGEHDLQQTLDEMQEAYDIARRDARQQAMGGSPYTRKDTNGRYLLLDALTAIAHLQCALAEMRRTRSAGGEEGDSGLLGSVIVLVVIAAIAMLLGAPVVEWFDVAVTATANGLRRVGDALG